jgi:hypothetical protein
MQEDEDFVKKHGKSILICFGCAMILNKEKEEEKFKENNRRFEGMCWKYEEEQIRISEEIANELTIQEEITENINEVNHQEIMEIEDNQEIDGEIERDITMTESEDKVKKIIKSERLQILIAELEKPRKNISEEVLTENGENLSLKQLCQKIRRRDQTLLEDYYYLGKKFKERLEKEMNKRRTAKEIRRKNDSKEREKIYKEMLETGVKETKKGLKRMIERGEKAFKLIEGIGREKLRSMCGIFTIDKCNKKEIEEAIKYFKKSNE